MNTGIALIKAVLFSVAVTLLVIFIMILISGCTTIGETIDYGIDKTVNVTTRVWNKTLEIWEE